MRVQHRSQHPWLLEAPFASVSQAEILREIIENTRKITRSAQRSGRHRPTLVFDLDSTLFEVRGRTLAIVREFFRANGEHSSDWQEWIRRFAPQDLAYSLEETWRVGGKDPLAAGVPQLLAQLRAYWDKRFFSDHYLAHDFPFPGARHYVRVHWGMGAKIVYLTGRDGPRMGRGTVAQLRHWGFPVCDRSAQLVMKPERTQDDTEFKSDYLRELRTRESVLAIFDNEPAHFAQFEKQIPDAILVFCHTTCSVKPADPVKKIFKIHDFQF